MARGTHPLALTLHGERHKHYREFMDTVRGHSMTPIIHYMDDVTHMRWRGSSKSEMAYYYATAKLPDRLGCVFPMAARVNLKAMAKYIAKYEEI